MHRVNKIHNPKGTSLPMTPLNRRGQQTRGVNHVTMPPLDTPRLPPPYRQFTIWEIYSTLYFLYCVCWFRGGGVHYYLRFTVPNRKKGEGEFTFALGNCSSGVICPGGHRNKTWQASYHRENFPEQGIRVKLVWSVCKRLMQSRSGQVSVTRK